MGYFSLFFSALASATLLPGSSEALMLYLLQQPQWQPEWLWLAATLGNTLGSAINWGLGRSGYHLRHKSWFPVSEQQLDKGRRHFERWGKWSLLFAWLPVVGDPLTLLAGLLRVPFLWFLVLVLIGKGVRYGLLVLAMSGFF